MTSWDAARAASRRPVRKYKPVGPVGPQNGEHLRATDMNKVHCAVIASSHLVDYTAHKCCGRIVCSCPPKAAPLQPRLDDGHYRCHRCRAGQSCVYVPLRTCQQLIDDHKRPSVGDQLLKAIESLRASARLCGRMLAGDVQLVVSQFVRVGASHAFIAPDSGIVAVCHPDDAAEVRRTLGLVGL